MSVPTEKSAGKFNGPPPPTAAEAYALCQWVDALTPDLIAPVPPSPWQLYWFPEGGALKQQNFAVMFQNSINHLQFVLVIQGSTDFLDDFEDLCVEFQAPFDAIEGAQAAVGVLAGLFNLLSLQNEPTTSKGQSVPGIDLARYIQTAVPFKSFGSLFITGRNLGGTLASLVAPWIAYQLIN